MSCHMFQRRLKVGTGGAREQLQMGMQVGIRRTAMPAFGAVSLEVRQLQQQFGHMARAFAGQG